MKIVHVFNMNNDAYSIVKFMRKAGLEADLIIDKQDFGMTLPQWEDGQFAEGTDPYALKQSDLTTFNLLPSWIKVWDQTRRHGFPFSRSMNRVDLFHLVREYDIIEAHVPFAVYAQFLPTPYVVYDAGWIRYFPYGTGLQDQLTRRAHRNAKVVLVTNPDTFSIFDKLEYVKRTLFMPFLIDLEIYHPTRSTTLKFDNELILFAPARHIWHEKGNDKMLRGYSLWIRKTKRKPILITVEWGPDSEKSKQLVHELGIEKYVMWIKPVHKRKLVEYYSAADIVLDQFTLGSYGTAAPEAMACEKPVIMYYSEDAFIRSFKELPPLLNAYTAAEIANNLSLCEDKTFR
ncbi:MAG: glycosyltransferase, partial [Candidatus Bathyarchaeia archaeon]